MDKLGSDPKIDIYVLTNNCTEMVKIDNPKEFGVFFSEESYIIDIKGKPGRYVVTW